MNANIASTNEPMATEAHALNILDDGLKITTAGVSELPEFTSSSRNSSAGDQPYSPGNVLHGTDEPSNINRNPQSGPQGTKRADDIEKIIGNITSLDFPELRDSDVPALLSDVTYERVRRVGERCAKLNGLYVQGLEIRVGTLERDVRELQVQLGQKQREENAK